MKLDNYLATVPSRFNPLVYSQLYFRSKLSIFIEFGIHKKGVAIRIFKRSNKPYQI